MPFGFGRKKETDNISEPPPAAAGARGPSRTVAFHGFTEDWRLEGEMELAGRLLDILNQREAIPVVNVRWAPVDGSAQLEPAPGIKSMDPYDLIVVIAGSNTLVAQTEEERSAHRIHKVSFDVALDAPPFRVVGTIQVHPGAAPESLLERGTQMFAAVTGPTVHFADVQLDLGGADAVLVNRIYLRDVVQVDKSTGRPFPPLPSG